MSKDEKITNEEPQDNDFVAEESAAEGPIAGAAPETDGGVELVMVEGSGEDTSGASVRRAKFAPLQQQAPAAGEAGSIDLLLDVKLDLRVELGRAPIPVREVLQLGAGSIVTLQKMSGEPVDILVNGKLIARGEVVVVDENFGVRVTEMVNRSESAAQVG
jgi:flagellar motor switch protein FliN/FliY